MMALATRYEVSAQVASSIVEERSPAMCSSETLTTVVSSTSMKVLNMTAIAMIHGLIWRCASGWLGMPNPPPDKFDQRLGVGRAGLMAHAENPPRDRGTGHIVN